MAIRLLTTGQAAKRLGISRQRLLILAKKGRVRGAIWNSHAWMYREKMLEIIPLEREWQDEVTPQPKLPTPSLPR